MILTASLLFFLITIFQANEPRLSKANYMRRGQLSFVQQGTFKGALSTSNDLMVRTYQVVFTPNMATIPSIVLGIIEYQIDSQKYQTSKVFMSLYHTSTTRLGFSAILETSKDYPNFIINLKFNYLAIRLDLCVQIVTMSFYSQQISSMTQNSVSNGWKVVSKIFPFSSIRNIDNFNTLKLLTTVVGHKFIIKNINSIDASSSAVNNSYFQTFISSSINSLTDVNFYVLIIDTITVQKSYKYYNHSINYNNLYSLESQYLAFTIIDKDVSNMFFGFRHFSANTKRSGFIFQSSTWNIIQYPQYVAVYVYVLGISEIKCESGFYNPMNQTCVQKCPQFSIAIDNNRYCNSCILHCTNCTFKTQCHSCVNTRQLTSFNTICSCLIGYYENKQTIAICGLCSDAIFGCIQCNSQILCNKCNTTLNFNFTPQFGLCICEDYRQLSLAGVCQCISGYQTNGLSDDTCQRCHVSCKQCQKLTRDYCLQCNNKLHRIMDNNKCVCLNFFVQLCNDQGLMFNGQNTCLPSVCYLDPSYQVQFQLDPSSPIKDEYSNTLIFIIEISPQIDLWNTYNFSQAIDLRLNQGIKINFQYQNGKITIFAQYTQNIQSKGYLDNAYLNISLASTSLSYSMINNYIQNYSVVNSMLAINVYSSSQYFASSLVKYATFILIALSFLVFVLGSYSSKIVVSEMMGIIQSTYFGIFSIFYNDPAMSTLSFLRYSNGFNDIIPKYQRNIPNRIFQRGFSQLVFENLNIMAILLIIPLIFCLVYFIISKIKKRGHQRYISYCKLCLGQWVFFITLFLSYNYSVSIGIFARYITVQDKLYTASIIQLIIIGIIMLFICIFFTRTDYNYFGEFKSFFKWKTFEMNYEIVQMILRICFGTLLGLFSDRYFSVIVVSVGYLGAFILTAIVKPYSDLFHSVRSSINFLFGSFIFGLYSISSIKGLSDQTSFIPYFPVIIVFLLYFLVFMAIYSIFRQYKLSKKIQQKTLQSSVDLVQKQQHQLNQYMKSRIQQQMKQNNGQVSFSKKLFLSKNKKKPKRKKIFNDDDIQQNNTSPLDITPQPQQGLTVARVMMVDNMLKEGLV